MGNHEFCVDCGESDFHYGRPCDPKKVAARLKAKAESEAQTEIQVERMKETLDSLGIEYRIDEYGNAKIDNHQFSDKLIAWRRERQAVKNKCGKLWWAEAGWDDVVEEKCVREKGHKGECVSHDGTKLNGFYKEKQLNAQTV